MRTFIILVIISMFFIISIFASSIKESSYTKAEEKRMYKKTMKLIYKGQHRHAEANLLELLQIDSTNINYNYELALLYYYDLNQTDKALLPFQRVVRYKNEDEFFEIYFYLGQAYQFVGEYDLAIKEYEFFKQYIPVKDDGLGDDINKFISECSNAKLLEKNKITRVRNLGNRINTSFAEYVPVPIKNDSVLLFTSKRPPVISTHYGFEGIEYFEKVYLANKSKKGYSFAEISSNFSEYFELENSNKWHNSVVSNTYDGSTLLIYKKNKLWTSDINNGIWQKPKKVSKAINFSFYQPHISSTRDGSCLYFTSWSKKKGFGELDIYKCEKKADGKWGQAVNLGSTINTKYCEDSPEISPDGKILYFSSRGHNGAGEYDIYKTEFVDGQWTNPENMGFPINSPGDDIFFKFNRKGDIAYFSSYRKNGFGHMDIYEAIFGPLFENCKPIEKNNLLSDIYIGFNTVDSVISGQQFELNANDMYAKNYDITKFFWKIDTLQIVDQLSLTHTFNCPGTYDIKLEVEVADKETKESEAYCVSKKITVIPEELILADINNSQGTDNLTDTNLIANNNINISDNNITSDNNIKIPASVTSLKNVYFDFDKCVIRSDAKGTLNESIKILKENQNYKIKIIAHADSRGPSEYNLILSQRRAKSVRDYLVNNGIEQNRIIDVSGKGENELVNNCNDNSVCSKNDHQLNRRSEILIVY
ncbi:MAG: OmpA family protein [Bacteroidota bacterium]